MDCHPAPRSETNRRPSDVRQPAPAVVSLAPHPITTQLQPQAVTGTMHPSDHSLASSPFSFIPGPRSCPPLTCQIKPCSRAPLRVAMYVCTVHTVKYIHTHGCTRVCTCVGMQYIYRTAYIHTYTHVISYNTNTNLAPRLVPHINSACTLLSLYIYDHVYVRYIR